MTIMGEDRALEWVPRVDLSGRGLSEDARADLLCALLLKQPQTQVDADRMSAEWLLSNVHRGRDPRRPVA